MMVVKKPKGEVLPSDIIYDILARLPAKDLIRFRAVNKTWDHLISADNFQKHHYNSRAEKGPLVLTAWPGRSDFGDEGTPPAMLDLTTGDGHEGKIVTKFSLEFPKKPTILEIGLMQSCRGLVCISYVCRIFVMNPSTRELIVLPRFLGGTTHSAGFGYDGVKDVFKVVRFFTTSPIQSRCEIFSLESDDWREVGCPSLSYDHINSRAPFVNGAVHVLENPNDEDAISGFNIETEEFNKIRLPSWIATQPPQRSKGKCLNELRGCLCLTLIFDNLKMEVWMLKDYENVAWEKEYTLKIPYMRYGFYLGEPLLILGDGTILLNLLDLEKDLWNLHRYDPNVEEYYENVELDCTATLYVESLFPLGDGPVLGESSGSDELADDDESANDDELPILESLLM